MRTTRRVLATLLPLAALPLGAAPLAGCGALSPSPGTAYGATSPSASASAPASAAVGVGAGKSGANSASGPMIPAKTLLTVKKTKAGYVLATAAGRTVYWYGKDVMGSGKSACDGGCLSAWPTVTGKPFVAKGVRLAGALGSITRPGGTVQATYDGYPLYTYAADTTAGETSGDGEGGIWHIFSGPVLAATTATAQADASDSQQAVASAKAGGSGM